MVTDGDESELSREQLLAAYGREVEARERAEAALQRFTALVQASSDLVAMSALSGEVLFLNQAGRDLVGLDPNETLPVDRFHTEEGLKRRAVLQEKGRWEGEGVLRHSKTGALIPTRISSFLLRDPGGKPMGYATVQRDLRHVRMLEQHVQRMQKMEATGRVAVGMAHDFNNMLSVIMGYGSVVRAGLPQDSELRGEIDELLEAARRAGALTKQLLAFGRQQVLDPRVVDLNDVVAGVEGMARRLLSGNVRLDTVLERGIGTVRVDVGQMEQVLLNLAANARDAMPSGGSLTVATGQVTIGESPDAELSVPPGDYVTLQVKDTGVGMDERTLGRLFEPFFTTKPPGAGTGLGLATAFGVVKQSGGHIVVSSRAGHGSTFTIYLPVAQLPQAQAPCPQSASPSVPPSSS
jgi:two-component system cell cycle sensor histidine kinase/response regulator CckA